MLARELEDETTARLYLKMSIAERRHTVSAIAFDALLGADAEVEVVDETDDDRQHALLPQSFARDVLVRLMTQRGQRLAEAFDLVVLATSAPRDERRIVDTLGTTGLVHADGLKPVARRGRDSHVAPGRRDDERTDALKRSFVFDGVAVGRLVVEAARLRDPPAAPD